MADVNKRLEERELRVDLTEAAKAFVTEHGYDPAYGARPLRRYIQKHVETLAARIILQGDIHQGQRIVIDVAENGETLIGFPG